MATLIPRPALEARELTANQGAALARAFVRLDEDTPACCQPAWAEAAVGARAQARLVRVALLDRSRRITGLLTLARSRAPWRTGSPGATRLTWPGVELGHAFRPLWRAECPDPVRHEWLSALRRCYPAARLELARCAPAAIPPQLPPNTHVNAGPSAWLAALPDGFAAYRQGLAAKHRRDLDYYARRILRSGALWLEPDPTQCDHALDELFRLQGEGQAGGGARRRELSPALERLLRAVAHAHLGIGLRLSLLRQGGRVIAAGLGLVHRGCYSALLAAHDSTCQGLDLGRQVLWHQITGEAERGLRRLDLGVGERVHQREFALAPHPTVDLLALPTRSARLHQIARHTLTGMRRIRRWWQPTGTLAPTPR